MRTPTSRDYEAAFAFTRWLYSCTDPAELRRVAVRAIAEMIGGDRVTFEHIAQAHDNARAAVRLRRLVRRQNDVAGWLNQTAILLNAAGIVVHCPAQARRWLRMYFRNGFQRGELPSDLAAWVRAGLATISEECRSSSPLVPFVREDHGSRLVCRIRGEEDGGRFAIVLEQQTVPGDETVRALGLTPRQMQILLEVEKGRSNEEIAAALSISPLTVRTHLDHVFDALNVSNRTAAVARLREMV